jgi:hypothetical protein
MFSSWQLSYTAKTQESRYCPKYLAAKDLVVVPDVNDFAAVVFLSSGILLDVLDFPAVTSCLPFVDLTKNKMKELQK